MIKDKLSPKIAPAAKPRKKISAAESKRRSVALKKVHAARRGLTLYVIVESWDSRIGFGRPDRRNPRSWSEYTSVGFAGATAGDNEIAATADVTIYGKTDARTAPLDAGDAADNARIGHFQKQRSGVLSIAVFIPLDQVVAIMAAAAGGKIEQIYLQLDLPANGFGLVRSISVGSGHPDDDKEGL